MKTWVRRRSKVKKSIYLDNSATTALLPEVIAKMQPFYAENYGNPSSIHRFGQAVRAPVEEARISVATALNVKPVRIVFTSGGTESNHLAVIGAALANKTFGKEIIISRIEHPAVSGAAKFLMELGFKVKYLSVNKDGKVSIDELKSMITDQTILVSIIYANNEFGTLQDIVAIGNLLHEHGIILHTDAVQAFPVIDLNVSELPVDLLSISAHKINGPKGVGALYIKKGVKLQPLFIGSQERKRRAGTENVAGIVGFGEASRILADKRNEKYSQFICYRNYMLERLMLELKPEEYRVNGHLTDFVPSILNLSFPGIDSHTMVTMLDLKGIAVSGGSACSAGFTGVSDVMKTLNLPDEIVKSSIRISFGVLNTMEEVELATRSLVNLVKSRRID